MKPQEFKETIFKQSKKYDEFIKVDDYNKNSYHSFEIQMKDSYFTNGGYIELTIDHTTLFCHILNFNGYTDDLQISDKYSHLNSNIIANVKVSDVQNINLSINAKELVL